MLVTIGDLLDDAALELGAVHVAREMLSVPVSWVHATEQLDPRPHLRPSELVCTLGSSLVRSHSARPFVEAVADAGAAGICLGLGEVHLEPPRALVEAAWRTGIPLLEMPHGVPFLTINDAVLKRRSQAESEARRAETTLLSSLLKIARNGASADELLAAVSNALGGSVRRRGKQLGASRPSRDASRGERRSRSEFSRPQLSRSGSGALEWDGPGPGPSQEFLVQLDSVLEFVSREYAREQAEYQQKVGKLIDLVADGLAHPAALLPDVEAGGLDPEGLIVSSWPTGSEVAIATRWPGALIGTTARGVVALSGSGVIDSIRGLGLVCGYSSTVGLSRLSRAVGEARAALRLARSRGGVVGPDQLVSFEALLEQQPAERLLPFVEQVLRPMVQADEEGRGDLVETLRVYLELDRHLQSTADQLYVHVNTVRHRLSRIQELSGRDPFSLTGIEDLRIALWAADRQRSVGHRLIRPLP